MCTYMYVYVCMIVYISIPIHMYMCTTQLIYTYLSVYIYIYIYINNSILNKCSEKLKENGKDILDVLGYFRVMCGQDFFYTANF